MGNHLALLALATRAGKKTLEKVFPDFDVADWFEDFKDGTSEDQESDAGGSDSLQLFVRQISVAGIALLC